MTPKLLITIIVLVLILLGLSYMWPFSKKSASPKIVETKTFSCPGMEGFTFEYPVLSKVKEIAKTGENECSIIFTEKLNEFSEPEIMVRSSKMEGEKTTKNVNPQGISYVIGNMNAIDGPDVEVLTFYPDGFRVEITVMGIETKDPLLTAIFQTVINSFRLTK